MTASDTAGTFLTALLDGRPDWPSWTTPPRPDRAGQLRADAAVTRLLAFLDTDAGLEAVERDGELPEGFLKALHDVGAFTLGADEDLGGLGLGAYDVFRVVEAAATRSAAVGFLLGVHNGIGVGASLLPVLPEGPLRDLIRRHIADGMVSGWADTDPEGQGNQWPTVTATPAFDGDGYVLDGEKLFISNGPVATLLGVTVTVRGDAHAPRVGLAVVDTADPGFCVEDELEHLGVRGLPNGRLTLTGVRVPDAHLVTVPEGDPRRTPVFASAVMTARLLIQAAPALAIARNCLRWSVEFTARRRIDGVGLGEYDLTRRALAENAADVRLMESAIRWALAGPAPQDRWFERHTARNICTDACARVADRTLSLLGGEGTETARSKRARGALPIPLERAYRDARVLRTAGGVDFLADVQTANALLARRTHGTARPAPHRAPAPGGLSPRNRHHFATLTDRLARFPAGAEAVAEAVAASGASGASDPRAPQYPLLLLGRIARELFGTAAVLAAAAHDGEQALTDVHCTAAEARLRDLTARLDDPEGPDHAGIAAALLAGAGPTPAP
ncbi:acyl-CoA/acyl-ACP dehydrogenase [Streptomyces niveiscabiei]|uniref:acyl-CoA dehydrogenase family protein n=1 Tax=Streptomyces niveiscabiei TaxID=164115 RepID=UPI0029B3BB66|nr:acyl-CoA dehydrogenase family protein [Streptomyces niveiscabiei]MDX3384212.1 acyl-CoA/acyl-ACP dehydrogenase [Streptomyces niveiscabiei]